MSRRIDLTGSQFGRLTVIRSDGVRIAKSGSKSSMWLCKCLCGNETRVSLGALKSGNTSSCGCYHKERLKEMATKNNPSKIIHGGSHDRLRQVWTGMKQRTTNPNSVGYKNYGARGITVCKEWFSSYEAFRTWALANGYDESAPRGRCTIDRIDNDKGYSPENCRFVDMKSQAQNRRKRG